MMNHVYPTKTKTIESAVEGIVLDIGFHAKSASWKEDKSAEFISGKQVKICMSA